MSRLIKDLVTAMTAYLKQPEIEQRRVPASHKGENSGPDDCKIIRQNAILEKYFQGIPFTNTKF